MILSFFIAYLLWMLGVWVFKMYFFNATKYINHVSSWSTAVIALLLLIYLCFLTFIEIYAGFFYEMNAFLIRKSGYFFIVKSLLEKVTLLFLTSGLIKRIREHSSFQVVTTTAVLINLIIIFLYQPITLSWLTARSVIPGWHTTILPPNGTIHLTYLGYYLMLIGLLSLIYSKINKTK